MRSSRSQSEPFELQRSRLRAAVVTGAATAAAFAAVLLGAGSASAAAWPDGAWTGSGTAATTVTSDGTVSDPVFDYATRGRSGNWTFQASAKTARTQPIAYHYKGYHAWSRVTVGLQQFVIHNGVETDTPLQSAGPVSCCAAPSGGFDYSGTASFVLEPNDVYGFKMSGGNFDSDNRLLGTLSLSIPVTPVAITNPGAQTGTVGTATSVTLTSSGGVAPITWSARGLPAGLSINASTGLISGTPTTVGDFGVTATATDAASPTHTTAIQYFTWKIAGVDCAGPSVLGNGGFELGSPQAGYYGWVGTASVFTRTGQAPHCGSKSAWFGGRGSAGTDTIQQKINLSAGRADYQLTFFLHVDSTESGPSTPFDTFTVQILNTQANATTLGTFSNVDRAAGYSRRTFDLKAFAGQQVTLRFTSVEDDTAPTSFVIDDAAVNVS